MAVQFTRIEEREPGVCLRKDCPLYQSFELYDFDEVEEDKIGDYYKCRGCKKKIYV